MSRKSRALPPGPFRRFNSSPEVTRLVVLMYVRFPLSLQNVEDLLFERRIDLCHETVRMWWNRFGPMFAGDIRSQRVSAMRGFRNWRWHLGEVYVKINGEMHYLWRAVDHESEVLESYVTKTRDKAAALTFMKKTLKRHGSPRVIITDGLTSYKAAMTALGDTERQQIDRWANAHRTAPLLGQCRIIDNQSGVFTTDLPVGLGKQRSFQRGCIPYAAGNKVVKLVIADHIVARGHRLNALAVSRANQARNIGRTHPCARLVPKRTDKWLKPRLKIIPPRISYRQPP